MAPPAPPHAAAITSFAPVLLFVYRRATVLADVLDALEACDGFGDHPVTVYSDGPRDAAAAGDVAAVRAHVRGRLRPNMRLLEREQNLGLANSIIAGVTQACREHGRAIVLEDDLILAPSALAWFRAALAAYADDDRVMQVSGFVFDVPLIRRAGRGVFLPHVHSWGWAVWQRSWQHFDAECGGWEGRLRERAFRRRFEVGKSLRYENMLRRQMTGQADSWAIRWHYSVVGRGGLVLYPPQSLVDNIGRDTGTGTHSQRSAGLLPFGPLWTGRTPPPLPAHVALDERALRAYVRRMRLSLFGLSQMAAAVRDFLLAGRRRTK